MTHVWVLYVPTWWWGAVTRITAKDLCTARYRGFQNRPSAMTKPLDIAVNKVVRQRTGGKSHLLKRTSQAWGARPLVISLFAAMVPTRKGFPTYKITDMPAVFVHRLLLNLFLSFSFGPSKRCERTADPVTLVLTTATQCGTRPITEDFGVCPALVSMTFHVLRGGATSTRADYLDLAKRARTKMTRGGAGV